MEWRWGPRHQRHSRKRRRTLKKRAPIEMWTSITDDGFHDWTLAALAAVARRPRYKRDRVYQWSGLLCRVRAAAPGASARIEPLNEDILRLVISEVADFIEIRSNAKGMATPRSLPPPR